MFCPKCASQNVEGASYCRACGANVSLVPQALNGQLPSANQQDDRYFRRAPSTERAIRSLMMGVVFAVMVALTSSFAPGRMHWWFWLLVPAMLMFSRGFFELVRVRGARNRIQEVSPPELKSASPLDIPSVKTGELMTAAPTVTEGTTRRLDSGARTRQL
jgi:hypothetical protein